MSVTPTCYIMDDDTPVIYGLEFQARALTSQLADSDAIRFLVGTQSLKLSNNQVHVVELNEDTGSITTDIYQHSKGEVWDIAASPTDASRIATCYNTLTAEGVCCMRSTIWRIPDADASSDALQPLCELDTEKYGLDVRTTCFQPTDGNRAMTVVDNHFLLWDLAQGEGKLALAGTLEGKGQPRFTTGKWSPHQSCSHFVTANEGNVRGWDLRSPPARNAWSVEAAHCQLVRDLDFNPNRLHYMATCGDDGCSRFWDVRNVTEPVLTRSDHSHWVWSIRYNHFHDQLVLTSSSDSRVILLSVASIASEPYAQMEDADDAEQQPSKERMADGVLATYDEHEDSVYSVEWSAADPWTFASLSYDGRLVINKVPKAEKLKILL